MDAPPDAMLTNPRARPSHAGPGDNPRRPVLDARNAPLYNTASVVQRTGVPAPTLHSWERRHGFPRPARDARGQRLYSERDIAAICWLAEQIRSSVSVGRAIARLRAGALPPGEAAAAAPDLAEARQALLEALLAFDPVGADAALGTIFGRLSVEDACLDVLAPVLVEVGEGWQMGSVCIAEEHFASGFVRGRLLTLFDSYASREDEAGPLVLAGCAPGERHEVGAVMLSLFLRRAHYRVRYVAGGLPLEGLLALHDRLRPALCVLSAATLETAAQLREAAATLAANGATVGFGGRVFNDYPELRASIQGAFVGTTPREARLRLPRLLQLSPAG